DARELIAEMLACAGATTICAGSGDEAIHLIATQDFDVLISDIGMPGMDGFTLMKKLRSGVARGVPCRVPALALTAYAHEADRAEALAAGFQEHVSKPADTVQLV